MITNGSIVLSKKGRDAGRYFIVARADNEYAYLVDGKVRRVRAPKKKKLKHLEPTGTVNETIGKKFANGLNVFDSEVFSALKNLNSEKEEAFSV